MINYEQNHKLNPYLSASSYGNVIRDTLQYQDLIIINLGHSLPQIRLLIRVLWKSIVIAKVEESCHRATVAQEQKQV